MRSWRILVVDDSPLIWAWARRMLAPRGHEVRTAGTLAEVREVLSQFAPEAVLLDLDMPGDIAPAATWLIRNRGGKETPIIIHSGLSSPTVISRARELAAAGILPKGASVERIEGVIERSLSFRSVLSGPEPQVSSPEAEVDASKPQVHPPLGPQVHASKPEVDSSWPEYRAFRSQAV